LDISLTHLGAPADIGEEIMRTADSIPPNIPTIIDAVKILLFIKFYRKQF
jgi:hypothetical protein